MNDFTKYVNILHLIWESPTLLWTFKLLMRADETRNSLNACFVYDLAKTQQIKNKLIMQGSHRVWKTGKTGKKIMVREKSGNFILGEKSGKSQGILF